MDGSRKQVNTYSSFKIVVYDIFYFINSIQENSLVLPGPRTRFMIYYFRKDNLLITQSYSTKEKQKHLYNK